MIRALIARQLRHQRALLVAVWAGLAGLEWLLVVVAARIEMGPGFEFLLELLPPAMRSLVATQIGMVSFGGLVAFGFTHPVALTAVVAVIVVLATVPAGERESGVLELILARPVPRDRYLAATVLLVVACSILLPCGLLAGAAVGLGQVDNPDEFPLTRYLPAAGEMAALLLAIGGYTLLFAVGAPRRGRAVAWSVGLTAALMWFEMLAQLWSPLESFRWLGLFYYYDPMGVVITGETPVSHPAVLLSVFLATTTAAFLRYRRQNL